MEILLLKYKIRLFTKYYKLNNNNLTLNDKLILGHNLNKLKMISEQIKSLHDEFLYKKTYSF